MFAGLASVYLSRGISRFNNARQSGGIPRPSVPCICTRALVGSARLSMPINNNHLYRILITRSKQTNKRREMRRAVREEVGLMLWWLRADLRSVGPPTSKMYLRAEYRSTCYECFNATVRPSSFFSPCFVSLRHRCATLVGREKFRYRTNLSRMSSDYEGHDDDG